MSTTIESDWENSRLQEELTQLRAKVAELEIQLEDATPMIGQLAYVKQQLATSQLSEKRLREALGLIDGSTLDSESRVIADQALSTPTDTAALDEYVAEKVKPFEQDAKRYRFIRDNPWGPSLEPVITLQQNAAWDLQIDATMAAALNQQKEGE